jgi:hypothetical protein
MSVLPCQCIVPCVQRSTLQRDFGRAKDHRAWPVPVLLKQGVYKLRGGVRGGSLSAKVRSSQAMPEPSHCSPGCGRACGFPTCHVGWRKCWPWRGEASPTATNSWCHGTGFGDCSPSAFCWCWCTREITHLISHRVYSDLNIISTTGILSTIKAGSRKYPADCVICLVCLHFFRGWRHTRMTGSHLQLHEFWKVRFFCFGLFYPFESRTL